MSGICFNEDNSHYYYTRADRKVRREDLYMWVEQYAGTQVKEMMLNVNAMKTSYGSKVWEPIWEGWDPEGGDNQPIFTNLSEEERKGAKKWIHTAWQIHNDGIDIYEEWIRHCRKCDISPWVSVRMNDVHSVNNEKNFMHSSFWRTHPELRRVGYKSTTWTDKALDYGREEVRDHYFRLIQELAERYDFDGLELDWMRFGFHFRPGYEEEGVKILNEFIQKVRNLLDYWEQKRGHKIKLGVRVPSRPETALGLGMDAVTWARKKLVDLIVITPFWATTETDMPVEIWKQLLDGTDVMLAAGLEVLIRAFPDSKLFQTNSLETVRGAAISYLARGVDRIYLFNYMDSQTTIDDKDNYWNIFGEIGNVETLVDKPRRHVLTYPDTWAPGEAKAIRLPAKCKPGQYSDFRIHIGPRPNKGKVSVMFGITDNKKIDEHSLKVLLNGKECCFEGMADLNKPKPEGATYSYNASLNSVLDGYNVIEVLAEDELEINWVEIFVVPHNE